MAMKNLKNRILAAILSSAMAVGMMGAAVPVSAATAEKTSVIGLTVNHQKAAMGVSRNGSIRFGWKMESDETGQRQESYLINVYEKSTDGTLVWTSGTVKDQKCSGISFDTDVLGLKKETKYAWTVTVVPAKGNGEPVTSDPAYFITDTDMSDAKWIVPMQDESGSMPILRTEQPLEKKQVESAYLYISSMGVYTAYIDGQEVKISSQFDDIFNPGWTDYKYYTNYQTYDVTDYIKDTSLTLGVELGRGWYAGKIGETGGYTQVFGSDDEISELGLIAKLAVNYADGTIQYISTDTENWQSSTYSPVKANDFFDGETYDANIAKDIQGWNNDGYFRQTGKTEQWSSVTEGAYKGELRSGNGAVAKIADQYDRNIVSAYTYQESEIKTAKDAGNDYGEVVQHSVNVNDTIALKKGDVLILDFG